MSDSGQSGAAGRLGEDESELTLAVALRSLRRHVALLVAVPLALGLLALGATYLMAPVFTATTTILPPQQSQGGAANALASLGALGSLAAGAAGVATPADRYVALMQSTTVSDRLIDHFKLMGVYESQFRVDARKVLASRARFAIGKKDGLITIEVEDTSPQRAADIANHYIAELRRLTGTLAVTDAQQRRAFFEEQLKLTRDRLVRAQEALQASGFSSGALKAQPQAAAEAYARLRAEATAAEVRLHAMRVELADNTPEVRNQQAVLDALREQLKRVGEPSEIKGDPDFIGRFREFKYQEALFELYARQFEMARADEAREGALIQVIDQATPPERRTRPKRTLTAILATLIALLLTSMVIVAVDWLRRPRVSGEVGSPRPV